MVNNGADNFVTSGNAVLRFEAIRYLSKSEISLWKILPTNKQWKVKFSEERKQYTARTIPITIHTQ
jgi:hypothetical protein